MRTPTFKVPLWGSSEVNPSWLLLGPCRVKFEIGVASHQGGVEFHVLGWFPVKILDSSDLEPGVYQVRPKNNRFEALDQTSPILQLATTLGATLESTYLLGDEKLERTIKLLPSGDLILM